MAFSECLNLKKRYKAQNLAFSQTRILNFSSRTLLFYLLDRQSCPRPVLLWPVRGQGIKVREETFSNFLSVSSKTCHEDRQDPTKKFRNSGSDSGMRWERWDVWSDNGWNCVSTCHDFQSDMTHKVPRSETGSWKHQFPRGPLRNWGMHVSLRRCIQDTS